MRSRIVLSLGLVALLALPALYAGQSTSEAIKAKIDFSFNAGGKTLPAGEYEFRKDDATQTFRIQGMGRTGDTVNIITELSGEVRMNPSFAGLVFDVVGDKYVLAEIWIPGLDGYLVQVTKGHHTHKVVQVR